MNISKKDCTGCTACVNVCPQKCINMTKDREGFTYPKIDKKKCVYCNLCEHVCPIINKPVLKRHPIIYAAINSNNLIRENSSSGGVFYLLANVVLNNGGVVFGAAFSPDFRVTHIKCERPEDLYKLQGSKYVQSDLNHIFRDVKQALLRKIPVYFSGTPCQIGGLQQYLGRNYDELICQDIICHGVPSPEVYVRYIEALKKQYNAQIEKLEFRNKEKGWYNFQTKITFQNGGKYKKPHDKDAYMRLYLKDIILRPSCYDCKFKGRERHSDITLADFWGITKIAPDMFDDKGTSLILISSSKGQKIFNSIQKKCRVKLIKKDIFSEGYNTALLQSAAIPKERNIFFQQFESEEILSLSKRLTAESFKTTVKKELIGKLVQIKRAILLRKGVGLK